MKLATLNDQSRDGVLVVVDRRLQYCQRVPEIAGTLQEALDNWATCSAELRRVYGQLNKGETRSPEHFDETNCHSPLPRSFHWADGSAYVNHIELVRKARGAAVEEWFVTDPLMYQGGSDAFSPPHSPIFAMSEEWGIDMEGEVAVITSDVAMGATPGEAADRICLVLLVNDVSLRNLIPGELAKGFGFYQSKPATSFSPVAVTPDELGDNWRSSKLSLPLNTLVNGKPYGCPNAGTDMTFDFSQLIAHAARTRELSAGAIIGSGTVSNRQGSLHGASIANGGVGFSCIAEARMYEIIETGKPVTSYLKYGDRVRIEMFDQGGNSIFGAIDQVVHPYERTH